MMRSCFQEPTTSLLLRGLLVVVLIFMILHLPPAHVAHAATITVNTTNDELNGDGDCSLREAIQAANTDTPVDGCPAGSGDDSIILPGGTYILTLAGADEDGNATGDLDITDSLTINGAGAASTVIDGAGMDRVLHLLSGARVEINGVKVTHGGNVNRGGGIYNVGGALTLNSSTVSGNTAGDTGAGGGIFNNQGTLTLNNSTVSGNTADYGGGIHNYWFTAVLTLNNSTVSGNWAGKGGGISNNKGTLTLSNSTVSSNTANNVGGGGIYSIYGTVALNNVTITDNATRTGDGGGINSAASTVNINNTIIAGNTDAGGEAPDCSGALNSQGHNLIGSNTGCTFVPATGDQVGTNSNPINPQLSPLRDNGGQTSTHALLEGSPAIDAGNPATPGSGGGACAPTDQRGQPRPADGNGDGTATCDIGAFEVPGPLASTPTATSTATASATPTALPTSTPAATGTPSSRRSYLPLVMGDFAFVSSKISSPE